MTRPLDIAGSTWLVTGCSSGFGKAIAEHLVARGVNLVATARDPATLSPLLATGGDRVLPVRLDVTDPAQVEAAVAGAHARFGPLDVLVNNAGFGDFGTIEESPVESARAVMETNYFGALAMARAVIPAMRARGSGRIVNIGSVAGQIGFPACGYYAAAKFAVAGLSETMAAELRDFGIHVTLAELGPFVTNFASAMAMRPPGPGYDLAAMSQRAGNVGWRGTGADPAEGAAALLRAVCDGDPPVRLLLGEEALAVVELHDGRRRAEREKWRAVSRLQPEEPS